jgi:NAD(P)-dependent dehydrogenase (short-subunit alcohol dehydrogenase family)
VKDVAGKVAVITGGGSGIGRAAGTLFAENGMKVVLADMNPDVLDGTVKELQGRGLEVRGVPTDVADWEAMKHLADEAFGAFGKVHVVMANAGTGAGGTFFDTDMTGWDRVIGVNIKGTLHGILAFLPRMLEQDEEGHIFGTTSGSGANGTMYTGPSYAATKNAVLSLMESLYGQLRDRGSKIKAGVIFPPLTRSNMGNEFIENRLQQSGVPAVLAEPEELAQVILEGIKNDTFYINPSREQDEKYFGGKLKKNIDWQDEITMAKAKAIIDRTTPDGYLWGAS